MVKKKSSPALSLGFLSGGVLLGYILSQIFSESLEILGILYLESILGIFSELFLWIVFLIIFVALIALWRSEK